MTILTKSPYLLYRKNFTNSLYKQRLNSKQSVSMPGNVWLLKVLRQKMLPERFTNGFVIKMLSNLLTTLLIHKETSCFSLKMQLMKLTPNGTPFSRPTFFQMTPTLSFGKCGRLLNHVETQLIFHPSKGSSWESRSLNGKFMLPQVLTGGERRSVMLCQLHFTM